MFHNALNKTAHQAGNLRKATVATSSWTSQDSAASIAPSNASKSGPVSQTMRAISSNVMRPSPAMTSAGRVASQLPPFAAATVDLSGSNADRYNVIAKASGSACAIQKLHESVFIDEDDFEDDAVLDIDRDYSTAMPDFRKAMLAPEAPILAKPPASTKTPPQTIDSTPIPWSSSPLTHKITPPLAGSLKRPAESLPAPESTADSSTVARPRAPAAEPEVRPRKRRTLPWKELEAREAQAQSSTPHRPPATAGRSGPGDAGEPVPWEKTASAVKAETRRLKKTKKLKGQVTEAGEGERKEAVARQKKNNVVPIFFSEEQKHILQLVVEQRRSVFFTGSAGTGKSVLLREIIKELRAKHRNDPERVAVTASTGLAACNVGGVTLHSFGGIGLGKEDATALVKKIKRNGKAKTRWLRTKVLIIDEISMVDGELFDKLEAVARMMRGSGRSFGGIQLVITGDFFQLPPVPDHGKTARFAFEANTWATSLDHTIGLTQVFRQKDPVFAGMLNEMRLGKLSAKSIEIFSSLSRPIHYDDNIDGAELFPTRAEVDRANLARMKNLKGETMTFLARDDGTITDKTQRTKLLANCMAPISLDLKAGAQVMLIKNMDESLVNGSLGKVIDFMDEATFNMEVERSLFEDAKMDPPAAPLAAGSRPAGRRYPRVEFAMSDGTKRTILCPPETWSIELPNGEVQASRTQVPLILAWALSIHKAQGQTLDRVKVDLGRVFEKGQAYVALSRATSQDGLQVLRFNPQRVMAHEKVRAFYGGLANVGVAAGPTLAIEDGSNMTRRDYEFARDRADQQEEDELAAAYA